jgi:NADP-dependent 3-hydroxy acid dehydrogenase YdfG
MSILLIINLIIYFLTLQNNMAQLKWNTKDIADQSNRVIIITGASSGLGKQATKILAAKNATVIMAVRNTKKGEDVTTELRKDLPDAKIEVR